METIAIPIKVFELSTSGALQLCDLGLYLRLMQYRREKKDLDLIRLLDMEQKFWNAPSELFEAVEKLKELNLVEYVNGSPRGTLHVQIPES